MQEQARKTETVIYTKVWEAPVRLAHWIMVLAILTLGITGYLIGNPPFSQPTEASKVFTFGKIRFVHFVAAYVLLSTFLLRLYWGIVGNRFSRWLTMLPVSRKRWRGISLEIKDLFRPKGQFRVYTGHSPLANVSYILLYLGVLFSIVTGFTLYAQANYSGMWRKIAGFGLRLFGENLNTVHFLHHLVLWFFALFLVVHLYLVLYTMFVSRTTEIDTMVTGKKFVVESELSPESE
jgi:Ni/Fe-hydrogenase 1 B-type cytochrome subunit